MGRIVLVVTISQKPIHDVFRQCTTNGAYREWAVMIEIRDLPSCVVPVVMTSLLQGCPHCGAALPVNGLVTNIKCPSCLNQVTIAQSLWTRVLGKCNPDALVDKKVLNGEAMVVSDETTSTSMRITAQVLPCAVCSDCGKMLSPISQPLSSGQHSFVCPSCKKQVLFAPITPAVNLRGAVITHYAGADINTSSAQSSIPIQTSGQAPIVMACPNCSASLQITSDSQRTTPCRYCQAMVYLPDDLWRQLHPVKAAKPWTFLVYMSPETVKNIGAEKRRWNLVIVPLFSLFWVGGLSLGIIQFLRTRHLFAAGVLGLVMLGIVALFASFLLDIAKEKKALEHLAAKLARR